MNNKTTLNSDLKYYKNRSALYYEIDELENLIDYIIICLKIYNRKVKTNQINFRNLYNEIIKYQVQYDFYPPEYEDLRLLSWSGDEVTQYNKKGKFCQSFNYVTGHLATPNYDMSCFTDSCGFHKEKSAKRIVKKERILTKKALCQKIVDRQYFLAEFYKIINNYLNYNNNVDIFEILRDKIYYYLDDYFKKDFLIEDNNSNIKLIAKK